MTEKNDKPTEQAWVLLDKLQPIDSTPDFKARFWARVREEEQVFSLWGWLKNPLVVRGLTGALALWILGVSIGVKFFARPPASASPTSLSFVTLLSLYPPNSIEQVILGGKL